MTLRKVTDASAEVSGTSGKLKKLAGAKAKAGGGSNALEGVHCASEMHEKKDQGKQLNGSILVTRQYILKVTTKMIL